MQCHENFKIFLSLILFSLHNRFIKILYRFPYIVGKFGIATVIFQHNQYLWTSDKYLLKIDSLFLEERSNMVVQDYGTTGLRKNSQGEIIRLNKKIIVFLVYITLVLDNILLTVVGKHYYIIVYQKLKWNEVRIFYCILHFCPQSPSYLYFYINMKWNYNLHRDLKSYSYLHFQKLLKSVFIKNVLSKII